MTANLLVGQVVTSGTNISRSVEQYLKYLHLADAGGEEQNAHRRLQEDGTDLGSVRNWA